MSSKRPSLGHELVPWLTWFIVLISSIGLADTGKGHVVPICLLLGLLCHLMWRAVGFLSIIAEAQPRVEKGELGKKASKHRQPATMTSEVVGQ